MISDMPSTPSTTSRVLCGFLASVLLVSCGGKTDTAACTQQFWNGEVGVCLPSGWKVMDSTKLAALGVPEEVVAAFQADQPVAGQFPNVTITREILPTPTDSTAYSQAAIRSVSTLPGYQLIDTQAATVDGKGVNVHIYSAQPVADQPKSRFYQISAVAKSGTGFTVTAYTPLTVTPTLEKQVLVVLKSLTFVKPKNAK
jgi:hypothetical protein